MALYYDCNTDHIKPIGNLRPVERVYALRFSSFTESDWKRLEDIYPTLPEWAGHGNEVPYWFGSGEDSPPFLYAGIEPSGLLVHGMLSPESWAEWEMAFKEHLNEFPTFEV